MEREEVLRRIREHLQELVQFDVRSISLFGSVARDEAGPASDVDVLVEFGQATFDGYMGLKFYLEDLLGTRVDVATRRGLQPRVLASAMREAVHVAWVADIHRGTPAARSWTAVYQRRCGRWNVPRC